MNLTQMRAALNTITGITTESIIDRAVVQAVAELSRSRPLRRVYSEKYEETMTQVGTGFAENTVIQLSHAPLRLNTPPTITVTLAGEAMGAILDVSNVIIDYHRARITVATSSYADDTTYSIQYTRDGLRVDFGEALGADLIRIDRIEAPALGAQGRPTVLRDYEDYGDFLLIGGGGRLPSGQYIYIYYSSEHSVPTTDAYDDSDPPALTAHGLSGSFPRFLDDAVLTGASGYVLKMRARELTQEIASSSSEFVTEIKRLAGINIATEDVNRGTGDDAINVVGEGDHYYEGITQHIQLDIEHFREIIGGAVSSVLLVGENEILETARRIITSGLASAADINEIDDERRRIETANALIATNLVTLARDDFGSVDATVAAHNAARQNITDAIATITAATTIIEAEVDSEEENDFQRLLDRYAASIADVRTAVTGLRSIPILDTTNPDSPTGIALTDVRADLDAIRTVMTSDGQLGSPSQTALDVIFDRISDLRGRLSELYNIPEGATLNLVQETRAVLANYLEGYRRAATVGDTSNVLPADKPYAQLELSLTAAENVIGAIDTAGGDNLIALTLGALTEMDEHLTGGDMNNPSAADYLGDGDADIGEFSFSGSAQGTVLDYRDYARTRIEIAETYAVKAEQYLTTIRARIAEAQQQSAIAQGYTEQSRLVLEETALRLQGIQRIIDISGVTMTEIQAELEQARTWLAYISTQGEIQNSTTSRLTLRIQTATQDLAAAQFELAEKRADIEQRALQVTNLFQLTLSYGEQIDRTFAHAAIYISIASAGAEAAVSQIQQGNLALQAMNARYRERELNISGILRGLESTQTRSELVDRIDQEGDRQLRNFRELISSSSQVS